jgi:hypothetical protein
MTKCKFCKNEAKMCCKIYGYNKFSFCFDCMGWVLIEISNLQLTDLKSKELVEEKK